MEDLWRKKYGSLPANTAVAKRSLQERRTRFDSADFFVEHGSTPETPSHSQSSGRIRQNHDNPGDNAPTGMTIKKKKKMYGSLTPKRSAASSSRSENNEKSGSRDDSETRTNVAQRILAGQHHLPSQRKRFDSADFFLMKEENQQKTSDSTNKKGGRAEGTDCVLGVRTGDVAGGTGPSSCSGSAGEASGRKALLKKMLKLDQRTRFDSAEYFSGGGEAIEGGNICQPASPPAPELISEKGNRQSGSSLDRVCVPNMASTSGQREMAERRIYGSDAQRRRSRFDSADYFLQASTRAEETQVPKATQSTGPDKDCLPTCVATGLTGGQRPQNPSASIPVGKRSSQSPARSSKMSGESAQLAPAGWVKNQMDRAAVKRFDSADFFGGQAVEAGDGLCYDSAV